MVASLYDWENEFILHIFGRQQANLSVIFNLHYSANGRVRTRDFPSHLINKKSDESLRRLTGVMFKILSIALGIFFGCFKSELPSIFNLVIKFTVNYWTFIIELFITGFSFRNHFVRELRQREVGLAHANRFYGL